MSVKLYSAWFCPFAQRAWVALLEKGVKFELVEIDPYDKKPEFLAVNPRGLVPVIVNNGDAVYESSVCIEYVDEAWKDGPPLLPSDPYKRAQVRIWSDFVSKKIVPVFYQILQRQTKEEQEEVKSELLKNLEILTQAMSPDKPYFMGKEFGMVDIMLLPFAIRFDVLNHYRGFTIPENGIFERFHLWMKACTSRDSVIPTVASAEKLLSMYQRYADNTAKSEVAVAVRSGKALP